MQYDCPQCMVANRPIEAAWRTAWAIRSAWQRSGVPDRFRNATLDNWRPVGAAQDAVLTAVRAYAESSESALQSGRGLILLGAVGVGKTHLAVGVTQKVIASGHAATFVRVGDLFAAIKRSFNPDAAAFDDENLRSVQFLILDDLGASRGTDWETSVLHDLLAHRYDHRLPTIVTTNESDFDRVVGERIADRFDENALRLTIAGTSQRKTAGHRDATTDEAISEPPKTLTLTYCSSGRMTTRTEKMESRRYL